MQFIAEPVLAFLYLDILSTIIVSESKIRGTNRRTHVSPGVPVSVHG